MTSHDGHGIVTKKGTLFISLDWLDQNDLNFADLLSQPN